MKTEESSVWCNSLVVRGEHCWCCREIALVLGFVAPSWSTWAYCPRPVQRKLQTGQTERTSNMQSCTRSTISCGRKGATNTLLVVQYLRHFSAQWTPLQAALIWPNCTIPLKHIVNVSTPLTRLSWKINRVFLSFVIRSHPRSSATLSDTNSCSTPAWSKPCPTPSLEQKPTFRLHSARFAWTGQNFWG